MAIVDGITGLPATVLGDDGIASFPSSIVTGSTVTDGGGRAHAFPAGGFRFPYVLPANYRLIVTPPGGFTAPSSVPPPGLAGLLDIFGNPYSVGAGSYADVFTADTGPALDIDLPVDPLQATTGLALEKTASVTEVTIGDFIQYALILKNEDALAPATAVTISDFLPQGFRYRTGSAHIDGALAPDPDVSSDGRTLVFDIGTVAPATTVRLTYVAEVASDARTGQALNAAIAAAMGGVASNRAKVAVLVKESFFGNCALLIGRVVEGECGALPDMLAGVPNVRLLLEDGTYTSTDADGQFHFEGVCDGTHVVQLDVQSLPAWLEPVSCIRNTRFAGSAFSQFVDLQGGTLWRTDFHLRPRQQTADAAAPTEADPDVAPVAQRPDPRAGIPDDATAAGGVTDWLTGATPGISILFPPEGHNPRSPATRVVVKHDPRQSVVLTIDGLPVDVLAFDGTQTSADKKVAVSAWRGIPLEEGDNMLRAQVKGADGEVVATLARAVHYANTPRRALLVPERSMLAADGIAPPIIAVRLLDAAGHPVRHGLSGPYAIQPPHVPQQLIDLQQKRQLAGLDRFQPTYLVEGDEGIAWIELQPTTQAGVAVLNFTFDDGRSVVQQELRAWLAPEARDWVVVGFAEGTLAYETLSGNMKALDGAGHEEDLTGDGQVSFYAKGRVKGSWLMTLAYDSDKPEERAGRTSLFQTIDPDEFYTLYGDHTDQRYDASSAENLYLRLERPQFYALFGDYDTGMTESQLSNYSRSFNGFKSEFEGNGVRFKAFAADADQGFVRDEIQGDGTSGLYRLSRSGIVINSEKIRLETRDRFQSQRIIATRYLTRHNDYDIDYGAGTIFFREPINARDIALNPIFIVAEYETTDAADGELNAGGRLAADLMDGRVSAGLSVVRDERDLVTTDLGGADVRVRLSPDTEVRLEGALSESQDAGLEEEGGAYLAEIEHHDRRWDGIVWVRRLGEEFGVDQQNAAESGTYKAGGRGRVRLTETLALEGDAWHQENLTSDATRDAGTLGIRYETDRGGLNAGGQTIHDESATGEDFTSTQATFGARRNFFDRKLELEGKGDISLSGRNDSVDFPTRYLAQAGWNVTPDLKLILAQELTNGESFDSTTTRLGLLANPWEGARLTSTVNQNINELGPRTFAQFGLTQALLLGPRWGVDFGVDHNRTFDESATPLVIEPDHPIASGGHLGGGLLTEDFTAVTAGGTYRAPLWSWNGRAESRQGEVDDRYGLTTNFLREATRGVAFAISAQGFRTLRDAGPEGIDVSADASVAWRPLGSRVTILDRLEFRYEELEGGTGAPGSGLFGFTSLTTAGDARSRAFVNNFNLNGATRAWELTDLAGNLFLLEQRSQWSIYYGSKYAFDRYDGVDYSGYTDMLGTEIRHDLTPQFDLGFQGSVLHSWEASDFTFSAGPSFGFSHVENSWITIGYNVIGFRDADFDAARYTAQGPWLKMRFKFDQETRMPRTWSGRAPAETTP